MRTLYEHSKVPFAALALALSSLCLHAYLFLAHGPHPLGYDTGFYRRFLIEPVVSFPNSPVPGLGADAVVPRVFLDLLRGTLLSPDIILYGSYLFFFALLPVLVFFLLRPAIGSWGAFFAAALVVLSPVQYNAYWYMLWKSAFALCLLFAVYICIERRLLALTLLLDIAIALSHKTTALIYISSLIIFFLVSRERRKETLLHIGVTGALVALVSFPELRGALRVPPQAIFLDWHMFMVFSIPFILLVINGISGLRFSSLPKVVLAFFAASFIFPIFHTPFYERVFVYADLALAMFAGAALAYAVREIRIDALTKRAVVSLAVSATALGLLGGTLWDQMRAMRPLLSGASIEEIAKTDSMLPPGAYVLTTSDEAPYFEGWTHVHVIAPGMLHDTHNLEQWMSFWSSTSTLERTSFINSFPVPLFVSTVGDFEDLLGSSTIPCLFQIRPHLFISNCKSQK